MKKFLIALIVGLCTFGYTKAQPATVAEDSLLIQLNKVEELGQWINDNLFSDMFDSKNPIPMMIFTDNSVLSYNPDSTLISIFQPREIGKTDNGTLYYLTNEVNPNFMMMVMGAPYEQGAYEKPWYYTNPWIFCSTFSQTQKMVPGVNDERDWYTILYVFVI